MPTEKEGQEIEEPKVETSEFGQKIPPEPPPEEPKPPTTEEQIATLQLESEELKKKYEQADKGLRSAQATLTQKDRLLKERENVREEIDGLKDMIKILATAQGSVSEDDLENIEPKKKVDIDKRFEELEQNAKTKRYQDEVKQSIAEYQQRVESLGLTEDDEPYWEIYKLVTSATPADFKLADIRLKKLEKEKTPVDNTPIDGKETEEELKKRLKEEIKREILIERGELDAVTGQPQGASNTDEDILKRFRENPNDQRAYDDRQELERRRRGKK